MKKLDYDFREYTTNDYEFVYKTKKDAYKKYVEENWGEWNEQAQRDMFVDFIIAYEKEIKIIMIDNKLAGFLHCETLENGNYEIGSICIVPEFQGLGIGTKILQEIIEKHATEDICLRYFKQNPVVKLYERLGFVIVEEMKYHNKMILKARTIELE